MKGDHYMIAGVDTRSGLQRGGGEQVWGESGGMSF